VNILFCLFYLVSLHSSTNGPTRGCIENQPAVGHDKGAVDQQRLHADYGLVGLFIGSDVTDGLGVKDRYIGPSEDGPFSSSAVRSLPGSGPTSSDATTPAFVESTRLRQKGMFPEAPICPLSKIHDQRFTVHRLRSTQKGFAPLPRSPDPVATALSDCSW
jgi:hypothetical protein